MWSHQKKLTKFLWGRPFFGHALFRAWEFSLQTWKILNLSYYDKWGLYSYVFWGKESIEAISFALKPTYDQFPGHTHFRAWEFWPKNMRF